jgi:hypothetical protein
MTKYCVEIGGTWYQVKKGSEQPGRSLDYELHNGVRGEVPFKRWITKEQVQAAAIKPVRTQHI